MAIDLMAVFRLQDKGTAKLRKIAKQTEQMTKVMKKFEKSNSQANSVFTRLTSNISKTINETNKANNAFKRLTPNISGATASLLGLASAYGAVQAAQVAFQSTIGEAMKFEQSEALIKTTFNNDDLSKQYMKMVDRVAIDSPILNSGQMFNESLGMLTMTKDMKQLETAWGLVEKMIAANPEYGIKDAVRGLRELQSGDYTTLKEVFRMDKNILDEVKTSSFDKQLVAIDKALKKMNITNDTVTTLGNTSLGLWTQITERVSKFMRELGAASIPVLHEKFTKVLDYLDGLDLTKIANEFGTKLAGGVTAAYEALIFIKDELKEVEGFLKFAKEAVIALTTAWALNKAMLAGFTAYKTATKLIAAYKQGIFLTTAKQVLFNGALAANPIGVTIAAIAALIGTTVLLVRNFDTVKAATKRVWDTIGGFSGALSLLFSPLLNVITCARELATSWDSTKGVWENVWGAIQRTTANTVNRIIDLINLLIDAINKIPFIELNKIDKVSWGKVSSEHKSIIATDTGGARLMSHYHGLDNVPYDGYAARLHKGERVLTAQENKEYSQGGKNVTINFEKLADNINASNPADVDTLIDRIAIRLRREMEQMA